MKESSLTNIFIYFLIAIFILLIIAPPLARVLFKEEIVDIDNNEDANNNGNDNNEEDDEIINATALTCRKEVIVGTMLYNIAITSNYNDDILNKVTFTYSLPETVDPTVTLDPVLTEIDTIRNSGLVTEETNQASIIFILTKDVKEANQDNTSLDTFFQPLKEQRSNLESLGYACSVLTA